MKEMKSGKRARRKRPRVDEFGMSGLDLMYSKDEIAKLAMSLVEIHYRAVKAGLRAWGAR